MILDTIATFRRGYTFWVVPMRSPSVLLARNNTSYALPTLLVISIDPDFYGRTPTSN